MKAIWFESGPPGLADVLPIISRFGFRWWDDMPDRRQQAFVVEPVHPVQHGQFYLLAVAPRFAMDHLGLVQPANSLGQGVVVCVAHAAHR